jgi:uncharacterized protein YciI
MLFVVILTDRPNTAALRQQWLAPHLDWLKLQTAVRQAGSLREAPDAHPIGGCWIVEAPDFAAVSALLETDPFWVNGLRETVRILQWSVAFPERLQA